MINELIEAMKSSEVQLQVGEDEGLPALIILRSTVRSLMCTAILPAGPLHVRKFTVPWVELDWITKDWQS